jgi:hypothetical protein
MGSPGSGAFLLSLLCGVIAIGFPTFVIGSIACLILRELLDKKPKQASPRVQGFQVRLVEHDSTEDSPAAPDSRGNSPKDAIP